ncbi:MAG TPA: group 1 glycosyl transferase [Chitinophagaceae bacterium]|nr:group 1 glycosyl transferase [Chitinophagaceae bacterium]
MQRICGTLYAAGYNVTLIGRESTDSPPLKPRPWREIRVPVKAQKGWLLYASYNWKLFQQLRKLDADAICAIDLDTIIPVWLVSKLKKTTRIYDAHELFTEQKEVVTRPAIHRFWKLIERFFVPRFRHGYTVNGFIRDYFQTAYGVDYAVIRNMPLKRTELPKQAAPRFILYQGAINEGRCFEQLVPAMRGIQAELHIYGKGNFEAQLSVLVQDYQLSDKIKIFQSVEPEELKKITSQSSLGLTLFEKTGLNQEYSLSNRFFDYMMAGIPQVCVNFPVYKSINNDHRFALTISNTEPATIAKAVNKLLNDPVLYAELQSNALQAREILNWEAESATLLQFYQNLFAARP